MSARWAAVAAVTVLATSLAGCSPGRGGSDPKGGGSKSASASVPSTPVGAVPVGPGPQSAYSVQKQPAPGSCHVHYTADKQPLPDPKCTPGATNPKVTPQTLKSTICSSGYTKGIRPPVSITGREKTANAKSYGYTGPMRDAEYDHLISLQLGGDPNDPRNLWVEPPSPGHKPGAGPNNPKDGVENKLKTANCSGKTDLAKAQQAIAHDWTTALSSLGIKE
ncbi:hypothetical protein [Streptomyces noursei]|uniref:hypothetical protein n=1 Tax=Streptomyces noursei TaxID=1971 RepID=UPI0016785936|nr:hypothetical protein [Streptomyces noursei]MCZ1021373.1 hypothetical protein [Streptomyces noursei]GGX54416.1 hypothetical protein GCM10010341_89410 [Streptomyces noursei]